MPFERPSLPVLIDRAAATMRAETGSTEAELRRSNLHVLARVQAGAAHGFYGYLDWLAKQPFPDSADIEMVRRWASMLNVLEVEAGFARARVRLSGSSGAVVLAGRLLAKASGEVLRTEADAVLVDGVADVMASADVPGAASSVAVGEQLQLVSPVAGVVGTAEVLADGLVSGADAESPGSLRGRVLSRLRQPPHGGARGDYVEWARQVPGVTRVWVYPRWLEAGSVGVTFVRDDDPDGLIPTLAEVAEVQALLETVAPVNARPVVFAPTPIPLDIALRIYPDTPTMRAAVERSLAEWIAHEAVPGGLTRLTHLHQVISDTPGEIDHELIVPMADFEPMQHEIAVLGAVTWL